MSSKGFVVAWSEIFSLKNATLLLMKSPTSQMTSPTSLLPKRAFFHTWNLIVHYHFHYWHCQCTNHEIKYHCNRPQYMTLLFGNNLVHLTRFQTTNYSIPSMITLLRTKLIIMKLIQKMCLWIRRRRTRTVKVRTALCRPCPVEQTDNGQLFYWIRTADRNETEKSGQTDTGQKI